MNDDLTQIKIAIHGGKNQTTPGILTIKSLTLSERIRKTVFRTTGLLLVTVCAVAVPILHFFLVPIGLAITAAVAINSYRVKSIIVEGNGACPSCGKPVKIFARPHKIPFNDICEHCHRTVTITE